MHAKVTVKLLVFTTFLANYTHLLKITNCDGRKRHCEYFEGSGSSKYPGIILQLILVKSFQYFTCQRPNNNKNKKILNSIHSTTNKDTASDQSRPLKFDEDNLRTWFNSPETVIKALKIKRLRLLGTWAPSADGHKSKFSNRFQKTLQSSV